MLTSGDGVKYILTSDNLAFIIGLSWGSLLLSWILNGVYYKIHPSSVDISPSRLGDKLHLYVFGRKISFTVEDDGNENEDNKDRKEDQDREEDNEKDGNKDCCCEMQEQSVSGGQEHKRIREKFKLLQGGTKKPDFLSRMKISPL